MEQQMVSKPGMHPDSKVRGANMGPTWVLSAPVGPHIGLMNLAIRAVVALLALCENTYALADHGVSKQENHRSNMWLAFSQYTNTELKYRIVLFIRILIITSAIQISILYVELSLIIWF